MHPAVQIFELIGIETIALKDRFIGSYYPFYLKLYYGLICND